MEYTTLKQIFEGNKAQLAESLKGMVLPADSGAVQNTIAEYFNILFDEKGIYRENLTPAEDYIFQSAMTLLNAQQNLAKEIAKQNQNTKSGGMAITNTQFSELKNSKKRIEADKFPHVMASSAIGSVGGALLLGTWGALFGAIAGTAIVLYSISTSAEEAHSIQNIDDETPNTSIALNVDVLLTIIGNICESVDELISTFRSQIKKVVHKYENQEKPTIERDYRFLLEGIQSLLGYKRAHTEDEDKYVKKLQLRIEDLGELLENYNLEFVDFDGDNEYLFEVVPGQNVSAPKMVYPAIVKNGNAVLKGKIFKK